MSDPFAISVLIRTRDSAKTLERVILGLGLAAEDELVVVDSGSQDATLAIAEKHGARIVPAPGPFNYSRSLNLGFAAARNPWVLVISSHAIPTVPNLLAIHRQAIRQFPEDVVVGYGLSGITTKPDKAVKGTDVSYFNSVDYKLVEHLCGNCNTIYRRADWETLPFDETIRTAEDKLWMYASFERGRRIALIPAARTLNCNQASLRYMFNKGYSDACAQCQKTPDPSKLRPMRLWHLGGALKNLAVNKLRGETNFGNWMRYSAHAVGAFFGSHRRHNNTPDWH
jgi:glycosyltransferase involved in cell wall biosynthesis